jgi:hypothetical protein
MPVVCGNPELATKIIGGMGLRVVSIEAWPTDDRLFPVAMSINADAIRIAQIERDCHPPKLGPVWVAIEPVKPIQRPARQRRNTPRPSHDMMTPVADVKVEANGGEYRDRKFVDVKWRDWAGSAEVPSGSSLTGAAPPWRRSWETAVSPMVPFSEMKYTPTNALDAGDGDDEWFTARMADRRARRV